MGRARREKARRKENTSPYGKRGSRARCVYLVAEDLPTDYNRFGSEAFQRESVGMGSSKKRLNVRATRELKLHVAHCVGVSFPYSSKGPFARMLPAGDANRNLLNSNHFQHSELVMGHLPAGKESQTDDSSTSDSCFSPFFSVSG